MILVGERQPPSRPRRVPAKLKLTLLCRGNHPLLQRGLERGQRLSGLALSRSTSARSSRAGSVVPGETRFVPMASWRLAASVSKRNASPGCPSV
jgi:hypothetical protein